MANAADVKQLDQWQDLAMDGDITKAKLRQRSQPVKDAMAVRNARLAELQGSNLLHRFQGRIAENWDELSRDDKKVVIGALITSIIVNPSERPRLQPF